MKFLVLTPLDAKGLIDDTRAIITGVGNNEKVTAFSPSFYLSWDRNDEMSVAKVFAIARALTTNQDEVPFSDRPIQVYVGSAPVNMEFDEIIILRKDTLSTQEAYVKETTEENFFENTFYTSEQGTVFFDELMNLLITCRRR